MFNKKPDKGLLDSIEELGTRIISELLAARMEN